MGKNKYRISIDSISGVYLITPIDSLSYCEEIIKTYRDPYRNIVEYYTKDGKKFLQIDSTENLILEEDEEEIEVSPEEKVVIGQEEIKQLNEISKDIERPKNVYQKLYFRKGVRQ